MILLHPVSHADRFFFCCHWRIDALCMAWIIFFFFFHNFKHYPVCFATSTTLDNSFTCSTSWKYSSSSHCRGAVPPYTSSMVCTEPIELQIFQLFQTKDDDDGHQKTNHYYYLQFQKSIIKPHQSNAPFLIIATVFKNLTVIWTAQRRRWRPQRLHVCDQNWVKGNTHETNG